MDSSQSKLGISNGQWTPQRHYESVPQHDESAQNILEPVHRSEQFKNPLLSQPPRYERVKNGNFKSRNGGDPVLNYIKDHRYNLFATLPLLAAMLETSLLVYFFMTYVSLPRDPETGALPRISPVYSTWPFTSCIGSLREGVYKTFAFLVAGLYQSGSLISLYLAWNKREGYWFRRVGAVAGLTSTVLLIWLTFSSEDTKTHTHLLITAAKILATLTVKLNTFICDHLDRKAKPILGTIPAAIILRRWKEVIAALSVPLAIAADVGIYACRDPVQIQTPGTTCFKIMAVGAPAEWLMSMMWINFMLNMAYDFHTSEHISAVVKAAYGTGDNPQTPAYGTGDSPQTPEFLEKGWSPRAEDFELDHAPFLQETEYPAKAWTSPTDELHFDSMALSEITAVRGFV